MRLDALSKQRKLRHQSRFSVAENFGMDLSERLVVFPRERFELGEAAFKIIHFTSPP